jgi:hypothetical protein
MNPSLTHALNFLEEQNNLPLSEILSGWQQAEDIEEFFVTRTGIPYSEDVRRYLKIFLK